jgi:hypothetical protein
VLVMIAASLVAGNLIVGAAAAPQSVPKVMRITVNPLTKSVTAKLL